MATNVAEHTPLASRLSFTAAVVIGDLRARAEAFHRDEHGWIVAGDPTKAREARLKADVVEEIARAYEAMQAALRTQP